MKDSRWLDNHPGIPYRVLFSLDPLARVLLETLQYFADVTTGQCWPSLATVQEASRMSKTSIRKYTKELVEAGLVRVRYEGEAGRTRKVYVVARFNGVWFAAPGERPDYGVKPETEPRDDGADMFRDDGDDWEDGDPGREPAHGPAEDGHGPAAGAQEPPLSQSELNQVELLNGLFRRRTGMTDETASLYRRAAGRVGAEKLLKAARAYQKANAGTEARYTKSLNAFLADSSLWASVREEPVRDVRKSDADLNRFIVRHKDVDSIHAARTYWSSLSRDDAIHELAKTYELIDEPDLGRCGFSPHCEENVNK